ncbi:MAG TPA: citramalate synthase [Planctomycetota bacterium]|nr:citramalate synthase [Planctomycetota bacterium]
MFRHEAPNAVEIYDSTLRDGTQSEHIAYSLADKVDIALKLDEFCFDYIEGGWPGSNPKDIDFFKEMQSVKLKHAKLAAFGSTHHAKVKPQNDDNLQMLVAAKTPVITIFGKSWDLHVTEALRVTHDKNLAMIRDSVAYLKQHCEKVVYDAEHWFDGFKTNRDYALKTLQAAVEGGAAFLVLCDTNGGSLPGEIRASAEVVAREFGLPVGIHTHNDGGLAVANTLAAIEVGACHVQGTVNGFGERCGNVDLLSVIPNLQLKLGKTCLPEKSLRQLSWLAAFVYETGNLAPRDNQPFVGKSAFAHKGGIHVSAVLRNSRCYEHIEPELVGNQQRVLMSELAGRSNVVALVDQSGDPFGLKQNPDKIKEVVKRVTERENAGYVYEAAGASFDLLVRQVVGQRPLFYKLHEYRIISELRDDGVEFTEATVKIEINGKQFHTAADGNGPVNALDQSLRKALEPTYPVLKKLSLINYKVRIVNAKAATAARVLVQIESTDGHARWTTIGSAENIIEASWVALTEAFDTMLIQHNQKPDAAQSGERAAVGAKPQQAKT